MLALEWRDIDRAKRQRDRVGRDVGGTVMRHSRGADALSLQNLEALTMICASIGLTLDFKEGQIMQSGRLRGEIEQLRANEHEASGDG